MGSAWTGTWRAGAWAACRELVAQATGATIGLVVRGRLASASPPVIVACGVGAALVMGWMVYRASRLAGAAAGDTGLHEPTARLAVVTVPVAAVLVATVTAARSGHLAGATALLTGKLTQRCVRYQLSTALSHVGPGLEVADSQGVAITGRARVGLDWHRAMTMVLPTIALGLAQEYSAPTPAADQAAPSWEQLLPFVLAVGMVEAARALGGILVLATEARAQGWTVQPRVSSCWGPPGHHTACAASLRDAGDAAALRQAIGVTADMVSVLVGQPAGPVRRVIFRTLRAELKALGEFRSPLAQHGRLALADRALPADLRHGDRSDGFPVFVEPVPITALV
jgi:hypothetical protein